MGSLPGSRLDEDTRGWGRRRQEERGQGTRLGWRLGKVGQRQENRAQSAASERGGRGVSGLGEAGEVGEDHREVNGVGGGSHGYL